jgi:hypothetical protein
MATQLGKQHVSNRIGAGALLAAADGWMIGSSGNFSAGLLVRVDAGAIGAVAILPLTKRH